MSARRAYAASHGSGQAPWKQRFRTWLSAKAKSERWRSAQFNRYDSTNLEADEMMRDAFRDRPVRTEDDEFSAMEGVEVSAELVRAQWNVFRNEGDDQLEDDLSPDEAIELAIFLQDELRREEEEARALALYEESAQFELEELQYQLEQWNIG